MKPSITNKPSPLAFVLFSVRNAFLSICNFFNHLLWVVVAWALAPRKPRLRILLVGQPRSGKTTILYRLKIGVYLAPLPTSGVLAETIYLPEVPVELPSECNSTVDIAEIGHNPDVAIKYKVYIAGGVCECELPYNYLEIFAFKIEQLFLSCFGSDIPDTEMRSGFSWEDEMWSKMLAVSDIVFYVLDSSNLKSLQNAKQDVEFLLFGSETPVAGKLAILANKQDMRSAYSRHFVEHTIQIPPEVRHRCKVFSVSAIANTGAIDALQWALTPLPDSPVMHRVHVDRLGASGRPGSSRLKNSPADETELESRVVSRRELKRFPRGTRNGS